MPKIASLPNRDVARIESFKDLLRDRAIKNLEEIKELGFKVRFLALLYPPDLLLEPNKILKKEKDLFRKQLLMELKNSVEKALVSIVFYLLTISHSTPQDERFLRVFYERYLYNKNFSMGTSYLLMLLEHEASWIKEQRELYSIYKKCLKKELAVAKIILKDVDIKAFELDSEHSMLNKLYLTFYEKNKFRKVKTLNDLRRVLEEYAKKRLALISRLGSAFKRFSSSIDDFKSRNFIELAFEPAMYSFIYYILLTLESREEDRRFKQDFLFFYLHDPEFRKGLELIIKVMLCKKFVRKHPAVKMLESKVNLESLAYTILREIEFLEREL